MKSESRRFVTIIFSIIIGFLPSITAAEETAVQTARQILDATGINGGLVVHLNCGDAKLTAALGADKAYLVQGLDSNEEDVQEARESIRATGRYGRVSVDHWKGRKLPFADNVVNLIVSERPLKVSSKELLRVLAPKGVAYFKKGKEWQREVKPRPDNIDEWTHFLHDASGNAVSHDDVVGPPRRMQWVAAPVWSRNHHKLASISSVVSAGGRIFYIIDEATAASMEVPGSWFLAARDAFNGVLLWRKTIPAWAYEKHKFRSGPVQLPRLLVASEQHVYMPLGTNEPVSAMDAATGKLIATYKQTEGAEEIILSNSVLLTVCGSPIAEQSAIDPAQKGKFSSAVKSIVAIDTETGGPLWKWQETASAKLMPLTLAANKSRAFFQAGDRVICLDLKSGEKIWPTASPGNQSTEADKGRNARRKNPKQVGRSIGWSTATLAVHEDLVLWASGKVLRALSVEDGSELWQCPCREGFKSPVDVFVADGLVWVGPEYNVGRDLKTGKEQRRSIDLTELRTAGHHHRCYREKATDRYILGGYRGIEFFDLSGDDHSRNNWVRGTCQYGILPCNGLVYAPSHACGCYMEAKLYGFWALAGEKKPRKTTAKAKLKKGPAYGKLGESLAPEPNAWPTLRRDPMRSGSTRMKLPGELSERWSTEIGGRLSAPVVARGTVLLTSIDEHRIVALDCETGKTQWTFTAGGRVDSPPTIYGNCALFGSADGHIYCIRPSDGQLVWRFRAAPGDVRSVALDQVESIWPVHGSILVQNDIAYAAAGRSSYLDGGILLYAFEPETGKILRKRVIRTEHPKGSGSDLAEEEREGMNQKIAQNLTDYKTFTASDKSDGFSMAGGVTTDILVGDGDSVYMRHLRFDPKSLADRQQSRHLFSTSTLLDDAEVHRSHWILGTGDFSRMPVAYSWIIFNPDRFGFRLLVPHGLMLAFDDETAWGVRRTKDYAYKLFADENSAFDSAEPFLPDFRESPKKSPLNFKWNIDLPTRPRAMLRAGELLLIGGMPRDIDQTDLSAAYKGRKGGLLWAFSTADGAKRREYKLKSPPVWDGMAAAYNKLYIATADGMLMCMGE
ncbi:MAG: outer membrane protein assembly factor BamB family protein [Planctomycetota bacterium]